MSESIAGGKTKLSGDELFTRVLGSIVDESIHIAALAERLSSCVDEDLSANRLEKATQLYFCYRALATLAQGISNKLSDLH